MHRALSSVFFSGAALHGSRHFHNGRETNCGGDTSVAMGGALAAVGVGAAGAGLWMLAERRRERDAIQVMHLTYYPGGVLASSTTFSTLCRNDSVVLRGSASTSQEKAAEKPSAATLFGLGSSVSGGSAPPKRLVVLTGKLLEALPKGELSELARLVEATWGASAEVHGLSRKHEARCLVRAVAHSGGARDGVVASVGDGEELVICESGFGAEVVAEAAVPIELAKGVELLAKLGPDVGATQYEWRVKRSVANAVRAQGGPLFKGHFTLTGCGFETRQPDGAADVGRGRGMLAGSTGLSKAALQQRLEGEAAAEMQWLRLHRGGSGEGCPELTPSKVASKRARVAQCIALGVLMDLAFDPSASFEVSGASLPFGLYLSERGGK